MVVVIQFLIRIIHVLCVFCFENIACNTFEQFYASSLQLREIIFLDQILIVYCYICGKISKHFLC